MKAVISWGLVGLMLLAVGALAVRGCGYAFDRTACPKCKGKPMLVSQDENHTWYECGHCGHQFSGPGREDWGEQVQDFFPEPGTPTPASFK